MKCKMERVFDFSFWVLVGDLKLEFKEFNNRKSKNKITVLSKNQILKMVKFLWSGVNEKQKIEIKKPKHILKTIPNHFLKTN